MSVTQAIDEKLEALVDSIVGILPGQLQSLTDGVRNQLKTCLKAGLSSLDLVTQTEFDAQVNVLRRATTAMAELQARIDQLENTLLTPTDSQH